MYRQKIVKSAIRFILLFREDIICKAPYIYAGGVSAGAID